MGHFVVGRYDGIKGKGCQFRRTEWLGKHECAIERWDSLIETEESL